MREHHALGLAGRARGEEDVGQVVAVARRQERRRCVVGHDLGPGGVARRRQGRQSGRRFEAGASAVAPIVSFDHDQAGQGPAPGHAARRAGASAAATTAALTPLEARIAGGANGRPGGVDRHVRRAGAQDAVDRGDGLEALGKPEADAIAAVDAPAGQPGREPVGAAEELGVAQAPAVLVLDGRCGRAAVRRPPRAIGLSGVHPWACNPPLIGVSNESS